MYASGLRRRYEDNLSEDDRRGCVIAMVATAVVCVSAVLSWRELVYLARSDFIDAEVLRVYEVRGRGRGTFVDFQFVDPGTKQRRRHSHKVRLGYQPPPGPLRVEFVSGAGSFARIAGHTQRWSLWVFGGSLGVATIFVVRVSREANAPIRRKKRYIRDDFD